MEPEIPVKTHNDQLTSSSNTHEDNIKFKCYSKVKNCDSKTETKFNNDFLNNMINHNICCCGGGVDTYNGSIYFQNNIGFGYANYSQSYDHVCSYNMAKYMAFDNLIQSKDIDCIVNDRHEHSYTAVMYDNDVFGGQATMHQGYTATKVAIIFSNV